MLVERAKSLTGVSRETGEKLEQYCAILRKWSAKINLVARHTLKDLESRHILDSLQVAQLCPAEARSWVDLGSGGGFPGLVVAIVCREDHPNLRVHLVESDQRKAAFLRTVSRETETPVTIHVKRAEQLCPQHSDIVSARALAPLPELLPMVHRHLGHSGLALLPKGRAYRSELAAVAPHWQMTCDTLPSQTESGSAILRIGNLRHV